MKQENIDFLEANKEHWEVYQRAQIIKHLDQATRQRMFDIVREEFAPNYITSLWCSSCVADLLKFTYTQYEKWKEENAEDESIVEALYVTANDEFASAEEINIILNGDPEKAQPMPGAMRMINEVLNSAPVVKAKGKRRNQSKS